MPMDASAVLWAYMVKVSPSFTLMPHGTVRWQSSFKIRLTAPWVSKRGVMVTSPSTTYQPAGISYHLLSLSKKSSIITLSSTVYSVQKRSLPSASR